MKEVIYDIRHIENDVSSKFESELKLTVSSFQSKGYRVEVNYNVLNDGRYTALVIAYDYKGGCSL